MAQINLQKTDTLSNPSTGFVALGIKQDETPFLVNESGIEKPIGVPSQYMMTGVFTNMFGGDPGGNSRDVLEWVASVPASQHSSVLPILHDCKIISAGFKWISNAVPIIGVGDSWTINVYKLNNPLTDSVTIDANYTFIGALNITLTNADSGVTVGKFSSGLNIVLNAGDMIRIAGDETGTIATSNSECQLTVLFEQIL